MGILDGVVFHRKVFDDQPPECPKTDFHVRHVGRHRLRGGFCARSLLRAGAAGSGEDGGHRRLSEPGQRAVPVRTTGVPMERAGEQLHASGAQRAGRGRLWPEWPTDRPLLISAFDFPVPKNEFVNLMRRTNDMPIADPGALYDDTAARAAIQNWHSIPTRPGGLAEAERVVQPNEVYNTHLRLIFYDEPTFRPLPAAVRHHLPRAALHRSDGQPAALSQALYSTILANRPTPATDAAGSGGFRCHLLQHHCALRRRSLTKRSEVLSVVPGQRS